MRQNANLFINLLNMMLSTGKIEVAHRRLHALTRHLFKGIPELQSHKDVSYLRDTLFLDMTEDEAVEAFEQEISTAIKDSRTVKINWAFHGAKHG